MAFDNNVPLAANQIAADLAAINANWELVVPLSGDLGTPSAGNLGNCTALPVATGLAAGIFANTGQPAFLAVASAQANVTGDATVYPVQFVTEIKDQAASFDGTSTFTAPVVGMYSFFVLMVVDGVAAAHTLKQVYLTTSNRTYYIDSADGNADTGQIVRTGTIFADMDAADTAVVNIAFHNGNKTVSPTVNSFFGGHLVC